MRDLPLDIIETALGLEPINVIQIYWTNTNIQYYADKTIPDMPGRIISLSNLNDVLRLDSSGSAGSVNIVLSDIDGSLKQIYDSIDIHLKTVKIYQKFGEGGLYLLFEGGIASPIVWDEGERTLTFDVISRLIDAEVGFAPYDGQFAFLNSALVGRAWPLPFGTAQMIPAISVQDEPTGILIDPFGIPDKGIPEQVWRLEQQYWALKPQVTGSIIPKGSTLAETNRILAQDAAALQAAMDQIQLQRNEIQAQIITYQKTWNLQQSYVRSQVNVYSTTIPNGDYVFKIDDSFVKGTFVRKDLYTGTIILHIDTQWWIPDYQFFLDESGMPKFGRSGALQYNFRYFTAGTGITVVSAFNLKYIVSCIQGTVKGVYAYRNYNGLRQLAQLPEQYYQIEYGLPTFSGASQESVTVTGPPSQEIANSSWISPVLITLKGSLNMLQYMQQLDSVDLSQAPTTGNLDQIYSALNSDYQFGPSPTQGEVYYTQSIRPREEWETDIYVVFESSVGPHPIDILAWTITTFSNLTYDIDNFNSLKDTLSYFSMNFALFEKKSLSQFLNEMAIHLCCYIYVKNEKISILNLRDEPASVDTITEDDIEVKSLQLQSTETENLITKYVATFQQNYLPVDVPTKIILLNNINIYGVRQEEFNFYAFNNILTTYTSAVFWMVRKSNTWKRIVFKTFLHKLNIETMDCVTLNFGLITIADQPIKGLVESAIYNSAENVIEMSVWIPIRLGELKQYPLAWYLTQETITPYIQTLSGGSGGVIPPSEYQAYKFPMPPTSSVQINFDPDLTAKVKSFLDDHAAARYMVVTNPEEVGDDGEDKEYAIDPAQPRFIRGDGTPITKGFLIESGKKPKVPGPGPIPAFNYKLQDYNATPVSTKPTTTQGSSVFPGRIKSGTGAEYSVTIYPNGIQNDGEDVNVQQLDIDEHDILDPGTWVLVVRVYDTKDRALYYMQVPIWL